MNWEINLKMRKEPVLILSSFFFYLYLKSKISYCIVVRDILHNSSKNLFICRILSVFYPSADEIAENPSEILMSCIRQKASGICQHSHKITEKSQVGKGCHLIDHPLLVVIEPPCASLLDLSYDTGILKHPMIVPMAALSFDSDCTESSLAARLLHSVH